jgi:hypothetical protein
MPLRRRNAPLPRTTYPLLDSPPPPAAMYDPLNNGFGSDDLAPGWPATPHPAGEAIPNMPRPATPRVVSASANDIKGPTTPQGREPQVYGQPDPGLVSPRTTTASNGASFEKQGEYLRVRITGLDRNRRDVLVRFDAQVWFAKSQV